MEENKIFQAQLPDGRIYNYGILNNVWVLIVNKKTKFYYYQFFSSSSIASEDDIYLFNTEEEMKNYIENNLTEYQNAKVRFS